MRCLFFEHRGLVDITGATYDHRTGKGEFGWYGPEGGIFTTSLADALLFKPFDELDASHDGFVTWNELERALRRISVENFRRYKGERLREAAQDPSADKKTVRLLLNQPAQTPQAFSLGLPDQAGQAGEQFAGSLGIYYELVPHQGSRGARLTRPPAAGSQAALLQLEPGDMVVSLDGIPIREPIDLQFHYGRTDLVFVNVRTGQPQAAQVDLGPRNLVDYYAANLGICYVLYPYGQAMGARVTRHPRAGTPCAGLRLEPGDMIISLDGQPIRSHNDVASHVARTTIQFIDVRTGQMRTADVLLPGTPAPAAAAPPE
jgi:hypothetical protein